MTTLRATRRLVGKKTHALKLVAGQLVGHSLQGAGVVGCSDAVRAIRAAIEERAEEHCCQRAIALDSCFDPHFYGMTTTVDQKYFFACAGDLDRPTGAARQPRCERFPHKWGTIAPRPTADSW